jgi:hypothetical protein
MAAALLLSSVGATYAATAPRRTAIGAATAGRTEDPTTELGRMSNAEVQGFGCLYTGAAATGVGALAGTNELILVFAGGAVVPTTPLSLVLAVTGTVFASFCAVGALGAPAVVRVWNEYFGGEEVAATK